MRCFCLGLCQVLGSAIQMINWYRQNLNLNHLISLFLDHHMAVLLTNIKSSHFKWKPFLNLLLCPLPWVSKLPRTYLILGPGISNSGCEKNMPWHTLIVPRNFMWRSWCWWSNQSMYLCARPSLEPYIPSGLLVPSHGLCWASKLAAESFLKDLNFFLQD